MPGSEPDVLVIGGGNAALCAALIARSLGADVLLLERSAPAWRGGNSKYTRNLRCVHGADPVMPGDYSEQELVADLASVTGEGSDPELTALAIRESAELPAWMEQHGIRWQPAMRGTLQLARTNRFFLGGGKALINSYYRAAERLGVRIAYEHAVEQLCFAGERCVEVRARHAGRTLALRPAAVVAAAGGYEANLDWLREYWGDGVRNYAIRGTRENDGTVLRALFAGGARARGNPRGLHAIAVDARGPRFEGGIVTRVDSIPFSIVVNRRGERFYDEGEEIWPKRYALWGRLIAEQPDQLAYSIFDERARGRFMSTAYPPYRVESLSELAAIVGAPLEVLSRTIAAYQDAAGRDSAGRDTGAQDAAGRDATEQDTGAQDTGAQDGAGRDSAETDIEDQPDGGRTVGLDPPKSRWASRLRCPPYYVYPLRPGITFTYLGVAVDADGRVLREQGGVFANLFAAGEIMAGNILLRGYLAGFGMTIGTVFGRRAGRAAAGV